MSAEKSTPVLAQRGWRLDDLVDLHYDAHLPHQYDQMQQESNKYTPDLSWTASHVVKKLYAQYANKLNGQDHIDYYATMLKKEGN